MCSLSWPFPLRALSAIVPDNQSFLIFASRIAILSFLRSNGTLRFMMCGTAQTPSKFTVTLPVVSLMNPEHGNLAKLGFSMGYR